MMSVRELPSPTIAFSITGSGADDALFTVDGSNQLVFLAPPDGGPHPGLALDVVPTDDRPIDLVFDPSGTPTIEPRRAGGVVPHRALGYELRR